MPATEHHLAVTRTARYHALAPADAVQEIWIVLHGYGQLARYFIRHFEAVHEPGRLIVAPEALSRFYLDGELGGSRRVGAAWMTKEDRLAEIDDYLAYLDAVTARVREGVGDVPVSAFGFSQGATTACRWAVLGRTPVQRLVLWAGGLPHDLDYARHAPALRALPLDLVVGTEDPYITPDRLEQEQVRLDEHAIPYRLHTFAGDHRIHAEMLRTVVG